MSLLIITNLVSKSYSQSPNHVSCILQYHLDLANPPSSVFAVTTEDQRLPSGKILLKGAKLIGKLSKYESDSVEIEFNTLQLSTGLQEKIIGYSYISTKNIQQAGGISGKAGTAFNNQAKSSVLGAIFVQPETGKRPIGTVLPRGTRLDVKLQ